MYSLDHAKLNLTFPPRSMWMNMGYWENNHDDFPKACEALLLKVLDAAGLLNVCAPKTALRRHNRALKILDLGFGCGDQTITLVGLSRTTHAESVTEETEKPVISALYYSGITLNEEQFRFAGRRLRKLGLMTDGLTERKADEFSSAPTNVRIFLADAGKPSTWPPEISASIESDQAMDTWILGLDSLYHFSPSRVPVLSFGLASLNASLMAFDLLLADNISIFQTTLLRVFCYLMGSPFSNFKTVKDYTKMLTDIGYDMEKIEISDVSQYVFGPLANYINSKDAEMKSFGLGGMGKFNSAASVFGWWARSGIIRGCIIIART